MNIILVLIPLTLVFLALAAWLFFWAVNHGQFDDMQSPSLLPVSDNLPSEDDDDDEDTDEDTDEDSDENDTNETTADTNDTSDNNKKASNLDDKHN